MKLNKRKFITFLLAPFVVSFSLFAFLFGGLEVFSGKYDIWSISILIGWGLVIVSGHLFLSKFFELANRWLKIDFPNSISFSDNIFQLPIISAGLLVFLLAFLEIPGELFLLVGLVWEYPMIVYWIAALVILVLYLKKLNSIFKETQVTKKLRILKTIIAGAASLLLFALIFIYYYFAIASLFINMLSF